MNKTNLYVILTLIVFASVGIVASFPDEASAMPAFARKYNAPCSSCHVAFPKLNAFGIAFKQRGYRSEEEGPGGNVWDMKGLPVGAIAQAAYTKINTDNGGADTSRAEVTAVEFFFGGVLAPNISFFGDFGADVAAGESLTPDLAFIIFDDIVSDSRLNLKIGGFDVDFPFLSDPRSPTLTGYLARINANGDAGVTLGRRGAEANGYFDATRTRYAVGVGNTAVTSASNSVEAVHAWVTQDFELLGFDQTFGVIASLDKNGDEILGTDDGTTAFGGALDLHYGLTGLILAYYVYSGNDLIGDPDVNSGLAELLHSFTEKLVGVARVDFQDVDNSPAEMMQYAGGLHYFFHPNVKGTAEFSHLKDEDGASVKTKTNTVILAMTVGF